MNADLAEIVRTIEGIQATQATARERNRARMKEHLPVLFEFCEQWAALGEKLTVKELVTP